MNVEIDANGQLWFVIQAARYGPYNAKTVIKDVQLLYSEHNLDNKPLGVHLEKII